MKRFLLVASLLLLIKPLLRAEGPDEQFVRIYNGILQADALAETGRKDQARRKYLEAQAELKTLRQSHPDWNEIVVEFRLKYVAEKLEPLAENDQAQPLPRSTERSSQLPSATGESAGLVQLLQEQVRQLTADKELLKDKLKEALTAQPAAVDPRELAKAEERIKALHKEVEVLKVSLGKAESKPDKPLDPGVLEATRKALAAANQKLAQQGETIAALTLEKEALQKRLQASIDLAEVKPLREENESLKRQAKDLQAKVEAQAALVAGRVAAEGGDKSRSDADRIQRLEQERAEELALLKPPELGHLKGGSGSARKSPDTLPAAAWALVTEAERAFSARHYEEAEKKYSQALGYDGKNVAVLANLAAVQIEQKRLTEAEHHLKKALAADPKDAFSWSLLGSLKVRQGKYDEALEALSQAAQLDPQDADTFQNLGVVLAEKGLREPAETAFRRAIRLAPGNGDAHHNLAVIYATQQPPSLELARWHYQKALQAGHGRNAAVEKVLRTNTVAAGGGVEALNH